MPKAKKQPSNKSSSRALAAKAVASGQAAAIVAVRRRAAARKARPAKPAAGTRRRALRRRTPTVIPPSIRRALAATAPRTGILIAEGDSWFDYPLNDVLSVLEDDHDFEIENVAHRGDTVEDMAYGEGQFDDFIRLLEKMLKRGEVPDAILLSGGGNDIAGDEFAILINHALSGLPSINDDVVRGVIDVRLRNAYIYLLSGLTKIARLYLNCPIPILLHGYDYPVPDGRGVLGGWWFLPGPWLQPGLHQKGHQDLTANKAILRNLMDSFNTMLASVSSMAEFSHVKYVNLRGTLTQNAGYKDDWSNELHPTKRGFKAVAAKIAAAI